jgi:hypothetical protein
MDAKKFREIEGLYKDLKDRQAAGEISADDMKSELKKLMIRDEENRYWMLGGKTGSWYVHDGTAWNAADPFKREVTPVVLQADMEVAERNRTAPGREAAPLDGERPEILCKFCHSRMDEHDAYCKFCGASQKAADSRLSKPQARRLAEDDILFKSVNILSLIIFFGGLGLILGVIFGASFGIFKILGDAIYQFPVMLQEMRGKIQGGIFFGAIGGIAGFIGFGLLAALLGMFFNALTFIFGGLRFKIRT